VHMNSTRWVTLTEFIKTLGRAGVARVDETEKGWFIAWIDNSPKALAKAVRNSSLQTLTRNPF
jgi:DNA/RNA-binding protein KIN17